MELKHKPHVAVAECRQFLVFHPDEFRAVETYAPPVGRLKGAGYLEQGSLPGTGGSYDSYNLTLSDGK